MGRVMAIANQKGGVGKTTTAVNLAACLADQGQRVVVIDIDPQGNTTSGLGVNKKSISESIYDVLIEGTPLETVAMPTALPRLEIVPANIDLAGAEIELVPAFSRETKLKRALETFKGRYDFVLIDCPPSLGLLTINALTAADSLLIPIQCEYYALEGLSQLMNTFKLVQGHLLSLIHI